MFIYLLRNFQAFTSDIVISVHESKSDFSKIFQLMQLLTNEIELNENLKETFHMYLQKVIFFHIPESLPLPLAESSRRCERMVERLSGFSA